MEIRIATAPCSWGVFYADGGTSGVPCETFLRQAAEAGYSEIELGPEGYLPEDGALLREALESSDGLRRHGDNSFRHPVRRCMQGLGDAAGRKAGGAGGQRHGRHGRHGL